MPVTNLSALEFDRRRGIAWVCDVGKSTTYLNDNAVADQFEEFLGRLYWVSAMAIEAAGGTFSKWTGDGFLGWFDTPLHRNLEARAQAVFAAAWHLTLFLNVTQLGVRSSKKFTVRHGIAYEQDALVTRTRYPSGDYSQDVMGRNVVLAFRIQEGPSDFPWIATQKELVDAAKGHLPAGLQFRRWHISQRDLLKHFKGERRGTGGIYLSVKEGPTRMTGRGVLRYSKKVLSLLHKISVDEAKQRFPGRFIMAMSQGPDWARESVSAYSRFLRKDLVGNIESFVSWMEKLPPEALSRPRNATTKTSRRKAGVKR